MQVRIGHNIQSDPAHKSIVIRARWCHNIIDSTANVQLDFAFEWNTLLIEDGNRTSNADNDQWLSCKDRKDHGAQDRGKQDFIDAKAHIRLSEPALISLVFSHRWYATYISKEKANAGKMLQLLVATQQNMSSP